MLVAQINGPVLELMTDSRTRLDQRIAGLGPDILAPELDEQSVPAPAARGRPDAPDRRRPARPADHRRDRQPVEGRRAASRPGSTRGGAPATSPTRRRWRSSTPRARACRSPRATGCRSASRSSTASPAARARAAGPPRTSAHAGRATTTGRHTGAHGVSAETDRTQGRGPDRPGQHARLLRRRAGQHGVDMIEFDVLPENQHAPDEGRLLLAHDYEHVDGAPTLEDGLAHLASTPVRRRRARRRPQAPRLRAARDRGAARARAGRAHADLEQLDALADHDPRARAEAAARLVGPAPEERPDAARG